MSEHTTGVGSEGAEVTKGLGKELGFAALIISILNFVLLVGMYYGMKAPSHAPGAGISAPAEQADLGPLREALAAVDAKSAALETAMSARLASVEQKADEAAGLAGKAAEIYVQATLGELDEKLMTLAEQAQTEEQIKTLLEAKQLILDVKLGLGSAK